MITRINHISFTISDLDRSVRFYRDVLGLECVDISERDKGFSEKVTGIKGAVLKIAYLKTTNCSLELVQYFSPPGKKLDTKTCHIGSAHVCFNIDGFREMVDHLRNNRVRFSGEPTCIPAGPNQGRHVLYIEDPDNNTIELISNEIVG